MGLTAWCFTGARGCRRAAGMLLLASLLAPGAAASTLAPEAVLALGHRIWKNESGGSREGLTAWNRGEEFASLGIGHFIWYPRGVERHFKESFPALLDALSARGIPVPDWLSAPDVRCPWPTRSAFIADMDSPRMVELRALLAATVSEQATFIVDRMRTALPRVLAAAPAARGPTLKRRFEGLSRSAEGLYALVDYTNFKGEGTAPGERYRGQGWGLWQVLETMTDAARLHPADDFANAAAAVLRRRIANSPPARGEQRWLKGWMKRVDSYRTTPRP